MADNNRKCVSIFDSSAGNDFQALLRSAEKKAIIDTEYFLVTTFSTTPFSTHSRDQHDDDDPDCVCAICFCAIA